MSSGCRPEISVAHLPYAVPELERRFPESFQLGESFPLELLTGVNLHRLALRFGRIVPSVVIGRHGYVPRFHAGCRFESTAVYRDGAQNGTAGEAPQFSKRLEVGTTFCGSGYDFRRRDNRQDGVECSSGGGTLS